MLFMAGRVASAHTVVCRHRMKRLLAESIRTGTSLYGFSLGNTTIILQH